MVTFILLRDRSRLCARLPADPRRVLGRHPAARGFTAIEMLIVIVIVCVLASIAMPSVAGFSVNQRLRMAGYDLIADLTFARGEAVKRNGRVTISRVGSSWAGGWTVADSGGNALRSHPALDPSVVETTGPAAVTFGLDGRQVGSTAATFTFDDTNGIATIPARTVVLDPSGRPKSL
jgi:type IV fimbrial biogenesis protein FimT